MKEQSPFRNNSLSAVVSAVPTLVAPLLGDGIGLEFHDVQMVVELDHCVEGEEYEEVIAFYAQDSQLRRWILWRAADGVIVQPLIGRSCRFNTVVDALETLVPARS